jgi:hypothetical protein
MDEHHGHSFPTRFFKRPKENNLKLPLVFFPGSGANVEYSFNQVGIMEISI